MRLQDVNTLQELISQMVIAISTGGNFLLNIGPDNNGRVLPIFEERLRDIGAFVNAHADAIFSTKPWIYQNDANSTIWYTSSLRNSNGTDPYRIYNPQDQDNTIIYAFVLDWPEDNLVNLSHVISNSKTNVILFGAGHQNISLNFTQPFTLNGGIQVDISNGYCFTSYTARYISNHDNFEY
uniref:alpha-L-fucosidase n=1 Tax=Acrobeloides nanus TaxID=290746 RepID=A0A914C005_9BILA